MFIDTHAHLNFKAFNKDLDQVIDRARQAGVEKIIIPGTKLDSSKKGVEIASKFAKCFSAVGIHPHHAQTVDIDTLPFKLTSLTKNPKVVAIGEIGLDYHQYKGYPPIGKKEKSRQKKLLVLQLKIAQESNLPVIFHCRGAWDDLISTIKPFVNGLRGVFHCFEGEKNHLDLVIKLGFFVGFDGNITYPENNHLRASFDKTPLTRLLLETDSPFLTPLPFRSKRNQPDNLPLLASYLADLRQKDVAEIAKATCHNTCCLFNL